MQYDQFVEEIVVANARGGVLRTVMVDLEDARKSYSPQPNVSGRGETVGNWSLGVNNMDLRPDTAMSYSIIDEMLKDGMPVFVMLMKLSQIMTVFRSWRGWKVTSPDEELAEVVTANLRQVLPIMMLEAGQRSLADGAAFMELLWYNTTKYQLGLSDQTGGQEWTVAKTPNMVDPRTIDHIRRTKKFRYNGFVQKPPQRPGKEIKVKAQDSLILPYDSQFRNLWGKSFFVPIYPYWFWYMVTMRAMVRSGERIGRPDYIARAPMRDSLPDPNTAGGTIKALDHMANVASSLAFSNYVTLPSDKDRDSNDFKYDINVLQSQSSDRLSAFIGMLQELSQAMFRSGLSADRALTQSSGGVGGYNIGELHAAATSMHNQLILTAWAHYINKYFMPLYSLYNKGADGPPVWLEVQAIDPEYRKLLQQLLSTMGNSPAGQEASFQIDTRTLFELATIPVLDEEEVQSRKKKLNDEAMEKQRESMALQAAMAPPPEAAAGRRAQAAEAKGAPKPPGDKPTTAEVAYDEVIELLNSGKDVIPIIVNQTQIDELRRGGGKRKYKRDGAGKFAKSSSSKGAARSTSAKKKSDADTKKTKVVKAVKTITKAGAIGGVAGGLALGATITVGALAKAAKERGEAAASEAEIAGWPKASSEAEALALADDILSDAGISFDPDTKIELKSVSGLLGQYDPRTSVLSMSPQFISRLADGDPSAVAILTHELAHSGQVIEDSDHPDGLEIPDPSTVTDQDINTLINHFEGQNQLVTRMALSQRYGRAIDEDQMLGMTIDMNQAAGFTGPIQSIKDPYIPQTETWAGLAAKWQAETGESKADFIAKSHDQGFSITYNRSVLNRLFASRMSGFSGANSLPSPSTVLTWLSQDGISGEEELRSILNEKAGK